MLMRSMIPPATPATGATLSCRVEAVPGGFEVHYTVTETSGRTAYVLDVQSNYKDPPARVQTPMYLAINAGGVARIVQGIAPLPPDREVYRRFIPLAKKLAPNGSLARVLKIAAPMQEQGPYDPVEATPTTGHVTVSKLVLDVHVIRDDAEKLEAFPEREPDDAHYVRAFHLTRDAHRVTCEIPIPATRLHEAPSGFVRVDPSAPPPAPPAPAPPRAPPPEPKTATPAVIARGAGLACELKWAGSAFELTYTVTETAGDTLYVMDLQHDDDRPGNRMATPLYVARNGRAMRIVQGIAPLPSDRRLDQRIIPVASRLSPRGKLTRKVKIPLPLSELGPYDPWDVTHPGKGPHVEQLILDVHVMRPGVRGFEVNDDPQIEGAFIVRAHDLFLSTERVTCTIDMPATELRSIGTGFVRVQ